MSRTLNISQATPLDESQWRQLLMEYGAECETVLSPEVVDRLWSWIVDPQHQINCAIAAEIQEEVLGFVHFRSYERALTASTGMHIEDIFEALHGLDLGCKIHLGSKPPKGQIDEREFFGVIVDQVSGFHGLSTDFFRHKCSNLTLSIDKVFFIAMI